MERRQHERYDLQAPVTFSWIDSKDARQRRKGLLCNISGGGFFVATHDLPPEGARILLRVSFRTVLAGTRLIVRASARVVRMELPGEVDGPPAFAAAIKTVTVRTDQKTSTDHGTAAEGSKTGEI